MATVSRHIRVEPANAAGPDMKAPMEDNRWPYLQGSQSTWIHLGQGISENVVWYVVRDCARRLELEHIAPHDLRRTCAKLCHSNGGELEQIQFLLGHPSVLTTSERHLDRKQNLEQPVNDRFGPLIAFKEVETS